MLVETLERMQAHAGLPPQTSEVKLEGDPSLAQNPAMGCVPNISFGSPRQIFGSLCRKEVPASPPALCGDFNPFLEDSPVCAPAPPRSPSAADAKEEALPAQEAAKEEAVPAAASTPAGKEVSQQLFAELRKLTSLAHSEHSYFSMAEDYFLLTRDSEYKLHCPRLTPKDAFIASLEPTLLRSFKSISKRLDRLRALTTLQRQLFFFFLKRFPRLSISRKAIFSSRGDKVYVKPFCNSKLSREEKDFLRGIEQRLQTAQVPTQERIVEWLLQGDEPGATSWFPATPICLGSPPPARRRWSGEEHSSSSRSRGPPREYLKGAAALPHAVMERVDVLDSMIGFMCTAFKEDVRAMLPGLNSCHPARQPLGSPSVSPTLEI